MLRIPRLVPLLPIGMKFVKVKEVISSHPAAGRSYRNVKTGLTISHRAHVIYNASFSYKRAKLFQLVRSYAD
jgi:hypothetical protein